MLTEPASLIPDVPASSPALATRPPNNEGNQPALVQQESKSGRLGGLVLTRHLGESIMIGDEVEVHVVGLRSGTVRLKVVAPRSIQVHRREIFDSIRSEAALAEPALSPEAEPVPVSHRPGKVNGGLVLARLARQSIMIGEDVEIGVVEVRPSVVKLRISAPKSVPVHRREVFESLRDGLA
jgi:carbon storage regulator